MGPMPPPDHGTSVPFRLLVETVQSLQGVEARVVNTQSGDKAGIPLYSPKAFMPFLAICWQIAKIAIWCDVAVSYGSQRFSCTVGGLTVLMLRLLGKPMHVRVAGGGFDNYYFDLPTWKQTLVRAVLRRAATLVVETGLVRDRMSPEFSNLLLVPNWIDTHGALPGAVKTVPDDKRIQFGFVAEIRAEKGVIAVLKAFEQVQSSLAADGITATLELVGPVRSDFAQEFSAAMATHAARVNHIGQIDIETLIPWIASKDVLLLPTTFANEGYPGVVLEALALGVPVIVSRWRALPEIVVHEHNGLLCEPADIPSLVAQMERMGRDSALRARLGANARAEGDRFLARSVLQPLLARCGIE